MKPSQGRAPSAGCAERSGKLALNMWCVGCRKEAHCGRPRTYAPKLSRALLQLKEQRSRLRRGLFQNEPRTCRRRGREPSPGEFFVKVFFFFLEPFNSSTSEPDTHGLLLCVGAGGWGWWGVGGGSAVSLWAEECGSRLCHSSCGGNALACWRLSSCVRLPLLY